jgi:hypothetical protein
MIALVVEFFPARISVNADKNAELTLPFLLEEVSQVVRDIKANLAPRPRPAGIFSPYFLGEDSGGDHVDVPGIYTRHAWPEFWHDYLDPQSSGATYIRQFGRITVTNVIQQICSKVCVSKG